MERYGSEFTVAGGGFVKLWHMGNRRVIPSQERATSLWQAQLAEFTPPALEKEAHGRAYAGSGGAPGWIDAVHSVQRASKIGACLPAPPLSIPGGCCSSRRAVTFRWP